MCLELYVQNRYIISRPWSFIFITLVNTYLYTGLKWQTDKNIVIQAYNAIE